MLIYSQTFDFQSSLTLDMFHNLISLLFLSADKDTFKLFYIEAYTVKCHFFKRNFREIGTAAMQVSIRSSVGYRSN